MDPLGRNLRAGKPDSPDDATPFSSPPRVEGGRAAKDVGRPCRCAENSNIAPAPISVNRRTVASLDQLGEPLWIRQSGQYTPG